MALRFESADFTDLPPDGRKGPKTPLTKACASLKPGESLFVPLEDGVFIEDLQNRLARRASDWGTSTRRDYQRKGVWIFKPLTPTPT